MFAASKMGSSNHHIKFLALATFVVFFWFVYRLGLHHDVQDRIDEIVKGGGHKAATNYEPAHYTPSTSVSSADDKPTAAKLAPGVHPDVLGERAAAQFCSFFRLDALARPEASSRKIYDLLLVNTELELLELRMGQMAPSVDYFVILESDKTFTDKPKPLHVQENWGRFAQHHAKMIRRTMDLTTGDFANSWAREGASRDAMYTQVIPYLSGEEEARVGDVLLVADVDELFKPEALKVLRNCALPSKMTFSSRAFYYSYQWLVDSTWMHPQATTYQLNDTVRPNALREHSNEHKIFVEAGWHCSYCFSSLAEMIKKITSFSHTEMDQPQFKDPLKILHRVSHGIDM